MLEILKENLKRISSLIGSVSIGILFFKFDILFSEFHIFAYFGALLGLYFLIYKSLKVSFENSIIETIFLGLIFWIPIDERLKSFLFGAFLFISVSNFLNKVKQTGKGKEFLITGLYVLIMVLVGFLFFNYPNSLRELRDIRDVNDLMWLLFALISLVGSI